MPDPRAESGASGLHGELMGISLGSHWIRFPARCTRFDPFCRGPRYNRTACTVVERCKGFWLGLILSAHTHTCRAKSYTPSSGNVGRRFFFCSYKTPPTVRISAPSDPTGIQAEAEAVLDKRRGFITGIELTNPGSGYSSALAPVTVEVRNDGLTLETGGRILLYFARRLP